MVHLKILPNSFLPRGEYIIFSALEFMYKSGSESQVFYMSDVRSLSRRRPHMPPATDTNVFRWVFYMGVSFATILTLILGIKRLGRQYFLMKIDFGPDKILYVKVDLDSYLAIQNAFIDDAVNIEATQRNIFRVSKREE